MITAWQAYELGRYETMLSYLNGFAKDSGVEYKPLELGYTIEPLHQGFRAVLEIKNHQQGMRTATPLGEFDTMQEAEACIADVEAFHNASTLEKMIRLSKSTFGKEE